MKYSFKVKEIINLDRQNQRLYNDIAEQLVRAGLSFEDDVSLGDVVYIVGVEAAWHCAMIFKEEARKDIIIVALSSALRTCNGAEISIIKKPIRMMTEFMGSQEIDFEKLYDLSEQITSEVNSLMKQSDGFDVKVVKKMIIVAAIARGISDDSREAFEAISKAGAFCLELDGLEHAMQVVDFCEIFPPIQKISYDHDKELIDRIQVRIREFQDKLACEKLPVPEEFHTAA